MIKLILNGEKKEFDAPLYLAELICQLGLDIAHSVVAVNYQVILKPAYATTELKTDDEVEVLTPHPGG